MTTKARRHLSRAGVEASYRVIRAKAFDRATAALARNGIHVQLRGIDLAALAASGDWTGRLVPWSWSVLALDWRQQHPDRFELAIWQSDLLYGLALGRVGSCYVSIHYIESEPAPDHPLRRQVLLVALAAARFYAIALAKSEIRLVDPLPVVIPYVCSSSFGFQLVQPYRQRPYCWRSIEI